MNEFTENLSGILLVDKPAGPTSHDIVATVREKLRIKRVGHAGTLDPMATGLLVILSGSATKRQKDFQGYSKIYSGRMLFGLETDTWDIHGKIVSRRDAPLPAQETVYRMTQLLNGTIIHQVPPYSAVKYRGRTLYRLARQNMSVPVINKRVTVEWLNREYANNELWFRIKCSSGTYVRSLAHRLGEIMACGGCLKELRREGIGEFSVNDAFTLDQLRKMSREEIRGKLCPVILP